MSYKIGIGYDIHRLVEGRKLFLGGVEVPFKLGLLGHSDADVLIHALCDALLGAAALSDIGELFPNTDAKYRDICSVELLKKVISLVRGEGYEIANIDAVLIAEEPALSPFKKEIRRKLASILSIKEDCMGLKAKTNEGLGELGAKLAIAAHVVALLNKEGA